jgi:hypothetical protein
MEYTTPLSLLKSANEALQNILVHTQRGHWLSSHLRLCEAVTGWQNMLQEAGITCRLYNRSNVHLLLAAFGEMFLFLLWFQGLVPGSPE